MYGRQRASVCVRVCVCVYIYMCGFCVCVFVCIIRWLHIYGYDGAIQSSLYNTNNRIRKTLPYIHVRMHIHTHSPIFVCAYMCINNFEQIRESKVKDENI